MLLGVRSLCRRNPSAAHPEPCRPRFRPSVECLEDRTAPTITITTLSDAAVHAGVSLRDAIGSAVPGDTITFQNGLTGSILLQQGTLTIAQDLNISGPGPGVISVAGQTASSDFVVTGGVVATISGLTITTSYAGQFAQPGD